MLHPISEKQDSGQKEELERPGRKERKERKRYVKRGLNASSLDEDRERSLFCLYI
jgi:hypothetical protein